MLNPYQPTFPMPYQQPQPQQGVQFVNGIESARMFHLPPNSSQILMDRNLARFYLVEADASGQRSVQAYDFREAKEPTVPYATKEDVDSLRSSYESLAEQVGRIAAAAAEPGGVHPAVEPAAGQGAGYADAPERPNHARPAVPSV